MSHLLLILLLSMMSTISQVNVRLCRMPQWSTALWTILWQGARGLTWPWDRTMNAYSCLSHVNVDCFWSSFLIGIENNTLIKSTAAHHEPEAMLICWSKDSSWAWQLHVVLLFGRTSSCLQSHSRIHLVSARTKRSNYRDHHSYILRYLSDSINICHLL